MIDEKPGSLISFYELYLRQHLTHCGFRYELTEKGKFRLWYRKGKNLRHHETKIIPFRQREKEENR
ncbi:MAG: hypothetical protein RML34_08000 [Leptospiraceae bacterium]|nr:hypothetical protein [Leptospiraceae bacterium]